ncbi:M23 family metallopeptidase [Corallibacter sp.]|uniref:M23 family metallopeptidase n=1 Tax=Corallibacter sp. TaxID=2038084 RepID=UPI003AB14932
MHKLLILFLFPIVFCQAQQDIYPQDYFRDPLDIPLLLAGTFGELRSNHFHSGIDIKTQQREGLKVYAIADGFVSRIKISHYGYGKALYITHPNGYTSVYAHLQRFSPEIEAYVKNIQYEKETYEIEVFPTAIAIQIKKGDIVAYSGNTGSSGGPHLHFEIRDNEERPINPMYFGIDIKDTTKPYISQIYAYPVTDSAHVNRSNEKQKLRLIALKNGDYTAENIEAFGKIGFGIETNDRQDYTSNKNGVASIQTFFNGNSSFEIDFKRFSFDETNHLNRLIDYEHYITNKERIQKLFVEENNPLSMYKNLNDNGYLSILDSTNSVYKIRVKDFKNNDAWITLNIAGKKQDTIKPKRVPKTEHYLYANQDTKLSSKNVSVNIPRNTFYDDFYIDFKVKNDTLTLHDNTIPANKYFKIDYDISHYNNPDRDKLYIARLVGYYKYPVYSKTYKSENSLSTSTKYLGTYALVSDTTAPIIKPKNFTDGKWLSNYHFLKIVIDDKESGISNYRATINGQWILMEYEYKTKTLTYNFNDKILNETKNNLKLIVTDNVGNSSTFEATFYRK